MGHDRANEVRPHEEAIGGSGGKTLDELNPYSPPACLDTASAPVCNRHEHRSTTILTAWTAAFASNLVVPTLFGLAITHNAGRLGMAIAVTVAFATGCWICARHRRIGILLIIGGIPTGLSQAVPVLQIAAGMVSGVVCQADARPRRSRSVPAAWEIPRTGCRM
jgi:hypothetical protein